MSETCNLNTILLTESVLIFLKITNKKKIVGRVIADCHRWTNR